MSNAALSLRDWSKGRIRAPIVRSRRQQESKNSVNGSRTAFNGAKETDILASPVDLFELGAMFT